MNKIFYSRPTIFQKGLRETSASFDPIVRAGLWFDCLG